MIRINLLGHEAAKPKKRRAMPEVTLGGGENLGFILVIAATLLIVVLGWWWQTSRVSSLRTELADVQAERDALAEIAARVREVEDRTALVQQKLDVIIDLKRNQSGPVMLLDQISRLLPDSLWLTQMTVSDGNVTIIGAALSNTAISDFLEALRLSADFADEDFNYSQDTGDAVQFQLSARFIPLSARSPQATPEQQAAPNASVGR